jgi:leucyl aminopeptidase
MPVTLTAAESAPSDVDVVAVPVAKGPDGPSILGSPPGIDADRLAARLRAHDVEGDVAATIVLDGVADDDRLVVAVGVGPADDVDLDVLRRASAATVRAAWKRRSVATRLLDAAPAGLDAGAAARAVAEGAALAAYRFTRFKSDPDACAVDNVVVVGAEADAVARGAAVAEGVVLARDLINTPPGDLFPSTLADTAREVAERVGLEIRVVDEEEARQMGLGGLSGVGQGSENPPRLVKLSYTPEGEASGHVAFVGKGITFDSGGLSLKSGEGMMGMKTDMSGAAAVLGALSVVPTLAPDVAVTGYLCAAENMPSGKAIRPGDVLTIRNGKTVEVLNTDAEGRLVLADGLSLAVEDGADAIVDVATLTGACIVALGPDVAGLMGNHDAWVGQVRDAADRAGESVWHLPLPSDYRKMLDSDVADIKNIGGKTGGALTAGLFLQEFVGDTPWVHLDIAGPSNAEDDSPLVPKGGTGFGVRTLLELALSFAKPNGSA